MRKIIPWLQHINFPDKSFPFKINYRTYILPSLQVESHFTAMEFQYITSGSGTYLIGNELYDVKKGDFLIIHRNELHYLIKVNHHISKICFIFSFNIFKNYGILKDFIFLNLFKCDLKTLHFLKFNLDTNANIDYIFKTANKEFQEQSVFWKESIILHITNLAIIIKRESEIFKKNIIVLDEKIKHILDYIDNNIKQNLSLKIIADNFGITSKYLGSKFKKIMKINFKDYLIYKKINEAKKILESKDNYKIISIAYDVGFNDLSHFNHVFKKITKLNPTQYKKMVKTSISHLAK